MKTRNWIILNENEIVVDKNCEFTLIKTIDGIEFFTSDRAHSVKDGKVTMTKQLEKTRYVPMYMKLGENLVRAFNMYALIDNDTVVTQRAETMIKNIRAIESSVSGMTARAQNGDLKVLVK